MPRWGGDSLRTIQLVSECGIDDLNTTDIYAARTAAKIAQRWLQRRQS